MLVDFFMGADNHAYNMNMVMIYILIAFIAFVICVIISTKLNIYKSPRIKKASNNMIHISAMENSIQQQVMNEVAATLEDTKGTKDEF